jgi:uptake hydrogenase large subunit
MSRLIVGPFNRVEGDLEVQLQVENGRVIAAHVKAPMYRGFEQILQGKTPEDALVYVPRICGICSISQSVAAARALASLDGLQPPPNGQRAIELMLATENLADHLSHFYLFFMPDFCRDLYATRPWHTAVKRAFDPQHGDSVRLALAARQRWMTMLGYLAGKWPHSQSIQPGGSAKPLGAMERSHLLMRLSEMRQFLERQLFGASLEQVSACHDLDSLHELANHGQGDLALFLTVAKDLQLHTLGPGPGRFMSYGAHPDFSIDHVNAHEAHTHAGIWFDGQVHALDLQGITEDCTHAWLEDAASALHPSQGHTHPVADKPGAYTWNKAPRLHGQVLETGALARQLLSRHALAQDLTTRQGGNVLSRVVARLLELAVVLPRMNDWLRSMAPEAPYCLPSVLPPSGLGVGLAEAARGSLGHWLEIHQGRIRRYQIVAPTSWNFSPRDALGQPGALEAALVGAPVQSGESDPVAVQHIVRSFDPCMVCTVH